mmetsp:Transcript_119836/g.372578  ORF Transcript_119836/g.372578 Transcript_119836/m.372578 type:complete len:96 (+) Transcript_119836:495-782(+)
MHCCGAVMCCADEISAGSMGMHGCGAFTRRSEGSPNEIGVGSLNLHCWRAIVRWPQGSPDKIGVGNAVRWGLRRGRQPSCRQLLAAPAGRLRLGR